MSGDDIKDLARSVVALEAASVAALGDQIDDHFVDAVRRLMSCTGHVLISGAGTSHAVAARLAHLLSCSGTPSLFIHPGDSQHGLAGAVTDRDVLVVVSKGGETAEVNFLARLAKERGVTVIVITQDIESTLGKMGDITLHVRARPDVDPHSMIATGSSLANAALGDALCVVLMRLRGYSIEEFGKTHPGGAVGRRLQAMGEERPA